MGSWRLRVLATPGHTPEHVAYVLVDPAGEPQVLFSGGALMAGTAARTDLFGPALSWRLAHDLKRSLQEMILELPDRVVVYPTHGGGSFCAVGAGTALSTTIGAERASNPLATARGSRQFVARSLSAGTYPAYYARMRTLNQAGAPLLGPEPRVPRSLILDEVDMWSAQSALVLVAEPGPAGREQAAGATWQLARIGYDRVVGSLEGGIESVPVHDIPAAPVELRRGIPLAVHCGHDYRATLGASLLERAGCHQLVVVDDGWDGWAVLDDAAG